MSLLLSLDYFTQPFVWRAVAAGALISLCAALLGVTLVLRRMSFMGDGLSHVAFGAMAVAGALGLAGVQMAVALPVTAICAVLLLRGGSKVQGDAALAMLSVGAMAAGYLMMNLYPTSSNVSGDVCSTLFGAVSILTLTNAETMLCIGLSIFVVAYHLLTYHRNFDIAFDEDFARASGVRTSIHGTVSAIVTAIVIVVSMRLVGALLVSALIVFPAVSAMRMAKSFRCVTALSAAIAVLTALAGIFIAVVAGTPVGATIVIVDVVVLLASRIKRAALLLIPCTICLAALPFIGTMPFAWSKPSNHQTIKPSNHQTIIASIAPLYDWTLNIVGERTNVVDVILLQRNGADLHSYQPSADDIHAIGSCDLFVHVGGISDSWVAKLSPRNALPLLDALPPRTFTVPACTHDHHSHDHEHHSHEHEHDHEHEHEAAHSHHVEPLNVQDEHIWLSVRDARICVREIARRICALDPSGADEYTANAELYEAALHKLDDEFTQQFSQIPPERRIALFADRFPFARLADDYRINCIAAFKGCSADAEASFHTIAHLAEEIDEHALRNIFVLEQSDLRLANAIRDATASKDQAITRLDSMQSAMPAPYLETMRTNLFSIATCL